MSQHQRPNGPGDGVCAAATALHTHTGEHAGGGGVFVYGSDRGGVDTVTIMYIPPETGLLSFAWAS